MNDPVENHWNSEEQLDRNAEEWEAWLEWKKICSVLCCSNKNRNLLSQVVFRAFERKLARVSPVIRNQWADDGTLSDRRDDFIQEFDIGIEVKAREEELARLRSARGEEVRREEILTTSSPNSARKVAVASKDYKKHAFNLALAQPDAPLEAIRGQLLGRNGIINAIVEHYLLYTCGLSLDWNVDSETGKRCIGFSAVSFDALEEKGVGNPDHDESVDDSDSDGCNHLVGFGALEGTFNPENGDDSPETNYSDPLDVFVSPDWEEPEPSALQRLGGELRNLYDAKQMAILLAGLTGMPISSPDLQAFCGLGRSSLDKKFHALVMTARDPESGKKTITDIPGLSKLRDEHAGDLNFRSPAVQTAILTAFRDSIASAPGGGNFLDALKEFRQGKIASLPLSPMKPVPCEWKIPSQSIMESE